MCDDDWSKQHCILNVNQSVVMVLNNIYIASSAGCCWWWWCVKASIIQLVRTHHYLLGARGARVGVGEGGRRG